MFRRVALTLGAGVALSTVAVNHTPSNETARTLSLSTEAGMHATMTVATKNHRSGYIVASS